MDAERDIAAHGSRAAVGPLWFLYKPWTVRNGPRSFGRYEQIKARGPRLAGSVEVDSGSISEVGSTWVTFRMRFVTRM